MRLVCMSFISDPGGPMVYGGSPSHVWPVHSTLRAAVLVPLAGASPLSGSP